MKIDLIIILMISLLQYGGRKLLCTGFVQRARPPIALKRCGSILASTPPPKDECPLTFQVGPYNAAEISVPKDANDDDQLLTKLQQSIEFWRENGYTSAWVTVPASRAKLIEKLSSSSSNASNKEQEVNFGFDLHHKF